MIEAYKRFWTKGVTIDERTGRFDFAIPYVVNFFIMFVLVFLMNFTAETNFGVLSAGLLALFLLAILLPSITLVIRRFHDMGVSGWLVILTFIPYVSFIVFFIQLLVPGTQGYNKWGYNPVEENSETDS